MIELVYAPDRQLIDNALEKAHEDTYRDASLRDVADQVIDLAVDGDHAALRIPTVQFVVDATTNYFEVAEARGDLPRDIDARGWIAAGVTHEIVDVAIQERRIHQRWMADPALGVILELAPEVEETVTANSSEIQELSASPFSDVRMVASTAFDYLAENNIPIESRGAIIANSVGLLAVAKVRGNKTSFVSEYLHVNPLLGVESYRMSKTNNGVVLRFSDDTLGFIMQHSTGNGCPASKINAPSPNTDIPANMLVRYWKKIVPHIVPADAETGKLEEFRQEAAKKKLDDIGFGPLLGTKD